MQKIFLLSKNELIAISKAKGYCIQNHNDFSDKKFQILNYILKKSTNIERQ